jgi:hypothetical protein
VNVAQEERLDGPEDQHWEGETESKDNGVLKEDGRSTHIKKKKIELGTEALACGKQHSSGSFGKEEKTSSIFLFLGRVRKKSSSRGKREDEEAFCVWWLFGWRVGERKGREGRASY